MLTPDSAPDALIGTYTLESAAGAAIVYARAAAEAIGSVGSPDIVSAIVNIGRADYFITFLPTSVGVQPDGRRGGVDPPHRISFRNQYSAAVVGGVDPDIMHKLLVSAIDEVSADRELVHRTAVDAVRSYLYASLFATVAPAPAPADKVVGVPTDRALAVADFFWEYARSTQPRFSAADAHGYAGAASVLVEVLFYSCRFGGEGAAWRRRLFAQRQRDSQPVGVEYLRDPQADQPDEYWHLRAAPHVWYQRTPPRAHRDLALAEG